MQACTNRPKWRGTNGLRSRLLQRNTRRLLRLLLPPLLLPFHLPLWPLPHLPLLPLPLRLLPIHLPLRWMNRRNL